LISLKECKINYFPDFIVHPAEEVQMQKLLKLANSLKIPVIPYGGGSGVCGGTTPVKGGIILDLKKMNKILNIDEKSLTVTCESGIIGENLEKKLNGKGYTLGHHPQSIYCSTLGGWIATRSAGQLSTKYGKIEDIVLGIRVILPDGEILETRAIPRTATGPNIMQIFLGSEGTLGIITQATLRIHNYPEVRNFSSFEFEDVSLGLSAIRNILQSGIRPAGVRLYDELDTIIFKMTKEEDSKNKIFSPILKFAKDKVEKLIFRRPILGNKLASSVGKKVLLILSFEGKREIVELEKRISKEICLKNKGEDTGEELGLKWWNHRFDVAYNLSKVFHSCSFADTIEVATTWDRIEKLYYSLKEELSKDVFIMAHFSHAYQEGCSVYFSIMAREADEQKSREFYDRIWDRAISTCLANGGTISHHHGVGYSKGKYLEEELKEGMRIYKNLKSTLDPNNILNPGKMGL
jgi:alkyldihydroxyacetonephosphate synthase